MKSHVPLQNKWTEEDKNLFGHAYSLHGKDFNSIKGLVNRLLRYFLLNKSSL